MRYLRIFIFILIYIYMRKYFHFHCLVLRLLLWANDNKRCMFALYMLSYVLSLRIKHIAFLYFLSWDQDLFQILSWSERGTEGNNAVHYSKKPRSYSKCVWVWSWITVAWVVGCRWIADMVVRSLWSSCLFWFVVEVIFVAIMDFECNSCT